MSRQYITRSVKSQITNDMIAALAKINGRVVVNMKGMLVVEFNHRVNSSGISIVEIVPFKLIQNRLKIIDPDVRRNRNDVRRNRNSFKEKYGNDRELLQKIENFLKMLF